MRDYIMQSYMKNERETERKDEPMPLLKMTSDFVFKAVLGQDTPRSQAALKALLTLLLQREDDPIESVKCENPLIAADYKGGKGTILDLKVRLSSGLIIDLEMQVNHLKNYINRTLFYMGKLIISSLEGGENYVKMKPTMVISIVDGVLFPDSPEIYSRYTLHEQKEHTQLTDMTQIHFLELGKVDIEKPVGEMSRYERLEVFLKYGDDETKQELIEELLRYETEVLPLMRGMLEEISGDKQMRYLEEEHQEYIRMMNTMKYEGWEEGQKEGREEGREEGRAEGREEGIDRMNQLTKRLLGAGRLDDLAKAVEDSKYRDKLFKEFGL